MPSSPVVRFGVFEVDFRAGELRKNGLKVRLQDQPFQVLTALLERPGEVVTREELRQRIWLDGTFVDFDTSLSAAVNKVRRALGDSADNPRFIETIPKRGYRFIGPKPEGTAIPTPAPKTGWYVGLAAALAAILVGSWYGLLSPGPEQPGEPMRVVPLTTYPGEEEDPDFSPDGEQVAFAWNGENQDNWDIYVKRIDSSTPVPLTTHPAREGAPAWSPDGRLIAFLRGKPGDRAAVFLIPAIGGPERRVAELDVAVWWDALGFLGFRPAWLPNRESLIISDKSPNGAHALFVTSIETGERRQLTEPPAGTSGDFAPALSPAGRTLAFVRLADEAGEADVLLLDLTENYIPQGPPKTVTRLKQRIPPSPVWSPDGSELIVTEYTAYWGRRLRRVPIAAPEKARTLDFAGELADRAAVSAKAKRLAFKRLALDVNIAALSRTGANGEAWQVASFPSSTRVDYNPQYSPDGTRVAFESTRTGSKGVWVSEADGSNAAPLYVKEGHSAGSPCWSPDSQRIAFDGRNGGSLDIFVMRASGGSPQQLTEHSAQDLSPSWSWDGKWIYFSSNRTGRFEVWKVFAAGGVPQPVTSNGGAIAFESPDGRFVYFLHTGRQPILDQYDLWKIAVDGGKETPVIEGVFCRNFSVTQSGIYFMKFQPAEREFSIRFLDFAGGRVRTLATLPANVASHYGFTVSPDEQTILYATQETSGVDLMLIENFR